MKADGLNEISSAFNPIEWSTILDSDQNDGKLRLSSPLI